MIFGGLAKDYWGADLSVEEYEYVVQVEFGADLAVDVSPVGPHADYIVAILSGSNTAIVARPERRNYEIASAAALELLALFGKRAPAEPRQLAFALQEATQSDGAEPPETRQLLSIAGKRLWALQPTLEPGLVVDAEVYVQAQCAQNSESCFVGEGRRKMLAENPELLPRALEALTQAGLEAKMTPRLLALVGSATGRPAGLAGGGTGASRIPPR